MAAFNEGGAPSCPFGRWGLVAMVETKCSGHEKACGAQVVSKNQNLCLITCHATGTNNRGGVYALSPPLSVGRFDSSHFLFIRPQPETTLSPPMCMIKSEMKSKAKQATQTQSPRLQATKFPVLVDTGAMIISR